MSRKRDGTGLTSTMALRCDTSKAEQVYAVRCYCDRSSIASRPGFAASQDTSPISYREMASLDCDLAGFARRLRSCHQECVRSNIHAVRLQLDIAGVACGKKRGP